MGLDTMTDLIKLELINLKDRYEALKNQGRKDTVALIVLNRMQQEIEQLQKKVTHEEKPRQEVTTRANTSRPSRRFSKAICRYWAKCNGDNYAIPSIPAVKTL